MHVQIFCHEVGKRVGKVEEHVATVKRIKTKYAGVFYREVARVGGSGLERVYYIVFKKDGKTVEEKAGKQYVDAMTPAKAAGIRADRIEGKRISRKEEREARKEEERIQRERPTLERIWHLYQEIHATNASIRTDSYNFTNHLSCFAHKTPDELKTADIISLSRKLVAAKKSPQTVKHVIGQIRRLIRFAVKTGMCAMPPLDQLHFAMPKVDNVKTENLTFEQITALKKALDEEVDQNAAAFMRLALATGMRKGALMHLQWTDIDFESGFITLRGDVAKKGKTERIPLNATARAILLSISKTGGSLYVFPGKDGGARKDFRRVARRVKIKAGLPEDFRPLHGLRHTYASLLASSGKVDLYTLQKLLTHSSPQMTQRYAHLADEAMHKAASVVDDILRKGED